MTAFIKEKYVGKISALAFILDIVETDLRKGTVEGVDVNSIRPYLKQLLDTAYKKIFSELEGGQRVFNYREDKGFTETLLDIRDRINKL